MTSKSGAELSRQAVALLSQYGYAVNVISSNEKATPDILGCINGRFFAIEIKGKGDTLKVDQSSKLAEIYAQGGIAKVAYSLQDVREVVGLACKGVQGPPPQQKRVKVITI